MTAKELLQPRFEVMSTYPNSKFLKGDILERIPRVTNDWYNSYKSINADILLEEIQKHPDLFREMNWWEGRTAEQMPKKVQFEDGEIVEIYSWNMKLLKGSFESHPNCYIKLNHFGKDNVLTPID